MDDALLYAIAFGFVMVVVTAPFLLIYIIARLSIKGAGYRVKKRAMKNGGNKEEVDKKIAAVMARRMAITNYVVGASFLVCMGVITITIIVESMPQSVLKRNLNGYEYFLDGREITRYDKLPPHPQDSEEHITTSVDVEKIPELLETNTLKACESDKYQCSSPTWRKTGASGMCTKAVWKKDPDSHYTEACVDIVSGVFEFDRVSI